MQQATDNPLAPLYYRDNFLRLCDTVQANYSDMLDEEETALLELFRQLSGTAQCLYVRLVSRVGPWFRESKLSYPELGPLADALTELVQTGLAVTAQTLDVADLDQLFTRAELKSRFHTQVNLPNTARKNELLAAIADSVSDHGENEQAFVVTSLDIEPGRIIAALGTDVVARLQVLFFGNRHQSLTDFILDDLGLTRYYPYKLDRRQRLFTCREAFEEYLACTGISDAHWELKELGATEELADLAKQVLPLDIHFPSSRRRFSRLCNNLARDLERLSQNKDKAGEREPGKGELGKGDLDELALALYLKSEQHPARERRARILENTGDWRDAKALCEDILSAPWCEAEKEAAQRILPRVQRKLDGSPQHRQRDTFDEVRFVLAREGASVEQLTASHLQEQWRAVHYVENSLMNTLFGLAFWDEIFAPVDGAFQHAYQGVPADMYERSFAHTRKQLIGQRLRVLACADLKELLLDAYRRLHGYQCHWVNWRYIEEDVLRHTLAVIPPKHLLAIWQRILFDPAENRRGFPDLIALGESEGDYQMIEVKGPGDALQDSQKRWLRYFQANGIPAHVAWVTWAETEDVDD